MGNLPPHTVSIPRGGPIYVPDMVGPITRVPNFEALVFHELQDLEGELSSDQLELFDTDILVDELKIIDEEELVNKAFEEAFKDVEVIGTSSQIPEQQSNIERVGDGRLSYEQVCLERPGRGDDALDPEDPNGSACKTNDAGELNQKKRKRKRRVNRSNQLEGSYIAKVEQLARIKQKQDEDKAAAKLHSFNGSSCQINECGTTSFAKTEKIRSLKSISSSTKVKASNTHEYVPVSYPEVVLCVEIYHNKRTWSKDTKWRKWFQRNGTIKKTYSTSFTRLSASEFPQDHEELSLLMSILFTVSNEWIRAIERYIKLFLTQEFLVLGQQFLTELRDKIYCLTDHVMKKAGQYDPSGYFLIEDVFCNDLREPSSIDYSKPILDWIENSKDEALKKWECIISGELRQKQKALLGSGTEPRLPKFKAVDMHKARFCDLRFRLGAGYVYCHQGDCKHIMVIRDMRLIHPEDVQNRTAYPLVTFQLKLRFHKCSVCKIYGAEKVTVDDKWAAEDPSYFCGLCYYMLHYQNGSLLYDDFSVFDYHHD